MKPAATGRLDVARAATLNTKLRLESISHFRVAASHVNGEGEVSPHFSYTMKLDSPVYAEPNGSVIAVYPVTIAIEHRAGERRVPLGELHVSFRAIYVKEPAFTSEDSVAVEHYVGIVGWMHVWPYVRAEVQSLSTKLGYPPLLLPVLLAGQTAEISVRRLDAPEPPKLATEQRRKTPKKKSPSPRGR